MSGLVGMGRQHLGGALQGGNAASGREKERNLANEQLKQAEKAQKTNAQMSGMGMGAGIGAVVGGPVGAGIGAAVGLFAGTLFG